jgi:hypothetical protein
MPTPVKALLTDFAQLNGVPLRYLLPDERLLPPETIRFLQVDQQWISHLVDGAYSIGRLTRADADTDLAHPPLPDAPVLTGALIRSELISGYPGLLIDAYPGPDATDPLDLHRCEKLSEQIMLILFTGTLGRLDLHQPPEAQHFAVEPLPDGHVGKTLRGTEHTASAPAGPLGTVPVSSLAAQMADLTGTAYGSGEFALQMIETAERVTYLRAVVGALGT